MSALVVLPPIMVWAENRGWVTRGLVDPDKLGNKSSDEATIPPDMVGAAD